MHRKIIAAAVAASCFLIMACKDNHHTVQAADSTHPAMDSSMPMSANPDTTLKHLAFAYAKDPSCGMPLTAGLEDSTTYKGKLYGFCSKECKESFLKDPEGTLAQIKK